MPDNQKTFHRYGVVAPPDDFQYETPFQPRKPIDIENKNNDDDLRNVYNPAIRPPYNPEATHIDGTFNGHFTQYAQTTPTSLAQGEPMRYNPYDEKYLQPIIIEAATNENGFKVRNSSDIVGKI